MRPDPLQSIQKRISDISQRMEILAKGPALRPDAILPEKLRYKIKHTRPNRHPETQVGNPPSSLPKGDALSHFSLPENKGFAFELNRLIEEEAAKAGVSKDLIKAIVKTESNGDPKAVSKAGAIGLMQLMPGTARLLGVNPKNPRENLQGGIRYLKSLARRYGDLDKTLAAYNAGPGNVQKYGDVPPFRETRRYIQKIRSELFDERR